MIIRFSVKVALAIAFVFLVAQTSYGQEINFINLGYSTAARPVNASVNVSIHQSLSDNSYRLRVASVSMGKTDAAKNIDKELTITGEQFYKLVNSVQHIKQADLTGGPHPSLLDGSSCSISFGSSGSSVAYQVNTPTHETDKRKLGDFLRAYRLILETAKVDPDSILD